MAQNHILLLGAHGNIAKMMIPKFLANSWSVTALIRNGDEKQKKKQKEELENIGKKASTKSDAVTLDVLFHNLSEVKTSEDAAEVIKRASAAKPVNWIVWSAGAGGKQGLDGTISIDGRAAIQFADAATHNDQIERYLAISAINARKSVAEWWSPEEKEKMPAAGRSKSMRVYTDAKMVADHCLTVWADERRKKDKAFKYVVLRPGALVDSDTPLNKVHLGKATGGMKVRREDVAEAAALLLEKGANGWFDMLQGDKTVKEEVNRVWQDDEHNETSIGNEDLADMKKSVQKWPEILEQAKKEVEAMT